MSLSKVLQTPPALGSAPSLCSLSNREAEPLIENMIQELKTQNLRKTKGLVALLTEMCHHHHPMTLQELGQKPTLAGLDQATVYRLMMKLEEAKMVRRFSFMGRSTHFQLNIHGHHHDYLICKSCEKIRTIHVQLPVMTLQHLVASESGWKNVETELEFYGICPSCILQKPHIAEDAEH